MNRVNRNIGIRIGALQSVKEVAISLGLEAHFCNKDLLSLQVSDGIHSFICSVRGEVEKHGYEFLVDEIWTVSISVYPSSRLNQYHRVIKACKWYIEIKSTGVKSFEANEHGLDVIDEMIRECYGIVRGISTYTLPVIYRDEPTLEKWVKLIIECAKDLGFSYKESKDARGIALEPVPRYVQVNCANIWVDIKIEHYVSSVTSGTKPIVRLMPHINKFENNLELVNIDRPILINTMHTTLRADYDKKHVKLLLADIYAFCAGLVLSAEIHNKILNE